MNNDNMMCACGHRGYMHSDIDLDSLGMCYEVECDCEEFEHACEEDDE
jgi:hypothetical protein